MQDGVIRPIEFNPLRFAGLGGTDISWYAYGFRTYEYYLEDRAPDWDALAEGKAGKLYVMSMLNGCPSDLTGDETFDYDAFCAKFSHVLALRKMDYRATASFGFLFFETDEDDPSERAFLVNTDFKEFLTA